MEFWKDGMLHFSEDMKECLFDWKMRFQRIHLEGDLDVEDFLAQIVIDLDRDWGCRLIDKALIVEFTEHKDEDNYKKALLLYREFMDQDTAYFPELTKKQAIRWIIRDNRDGFDFTAMDAFQSLLINHERSLFLQTMRKIACLHGYLTNNARAKLHFLQRGFGLRNK